MKSQGHTVRYVGRHESALLTPHLDEFTSLRAAREHLSGRFATPGDTLTLWPCSPHDSTGEAYSRINVPLDASHVLTLGPNKGVKVKGRRSRR